MNISLFVSGRKSGIWFHTEFPAWRRVHWLRNPSRYEQVGEYIMTRETYDAYRAWRASGADASGEAFNPYDAKKYLRAVEKNPQPSGYSYSPNGTGTDQGVNENSKQLLILAAVGVGVFLLMK